MFTFDAHPAELNTMCMTFVRGARPHLATAGSDGVRVWDLSAREAVRHLPTDDEEPSALTNSPDGRLLVLCQGDNPSLIRLWDWAADRVVKEIEGGAQAQCAVFTPDGRSLAVGGYRYQPGRSGVDFLDFSVRRLRADTWNPQRLLRGHTDQTGFLAFSPDGRWLASSAADRRSILWDLTTREPVVEIRHPTLGWGVAFSADGTLLAATGGKTIELVDVARGKRLRPALRGHTKEVRALAFAPDGRTLVSAGEDGTVRWWDVAARAAVRVRDWGLGPLNCLGFSADGTLGAAGSASGRIVVWDVDE